MTNGQSRTILANPESNTEENYIIAIGHYIENTQMRLPPDHIRRALKFLFDQLYVVKEREPEPPRTGKIQPYQKQKGVKWYKGVRYERNEQGNWVAKPHNHTPKR